MNSFFSRILGFLLIIAAVAGLIFSGWGLVRIWTIRTTVTQDILSIVELTQTTLNATSEGLILAESSITQARRDVVSLKNTLQATGRAMRATDSIFESLEDLLINDLPSTIQSTRTSLETAQTSARLIENFLRTLSSVPFLPIEPYNPAVPMEESLGEVSESLEEIPEVLVEMEASLSRSQGNMILIQAEFNIMARHVQQINESLTDAQKVVVEYQKVVSELQERTSNLETVIPRRINNLAWWITFILIWLGIIQLGILAQGLQMITTNGEVERVDKLVVERMAEKGKTVQEEPATEKEDDEKEDKT